MRGWDDQPPLADGDGEREYQSIDVFAIFFRWKYWTTWKFREKTIKTIARNTRKLEMMRRVSGDIHLVFCCCVFCYRALGSEPAPHWGSLETAHDQWWLKTWNILKPELKIGRIKEWFFFVTPGWPVFVLHKFQCARCHFSTEIWLATFI